MADASYDMHNYFEDTLVSKIDPNSELKLKGTGTGGAIASELSGTVASQLSGEVTSNIAKIAPVAHHVKEVNNIDPISIDAFHVNEIKNIDPIRIEKFHITNLPTVNMSLRQVPAVDLNVRRLPAISIGTHQNFCVPSNYTLRARFLGIEFLRINLSGQTAISPRERFRQEQSRVANKSFPVTATAGNPGIPVIRREKAVKTCHPVKHCHSSAHGKHHVNPGNNKMRTNGNLTSVGPPSMNFNIAGHSNKLMSTESSISSGE